MLHRTVITESCITFLILHRNLQDGNFVFLHYLRNYFFVMVQNLNAWQSLHYILILDNILDNQ